MTGYHKDALPTGYQLAEYVIETILGHGGFGITYLAKDVQLGTQVAIKEYLPQDFALRKGATTIVPNPEGNTVVTYQCGLKEFLREGQALARFKHSNIVRVLRFIEANGTAYMVMEYEKGTSLSQHLKGNAARLDQADLLRIFLPIMNGLQAVHEAGLLHLDIKPENIYLREDGTPMLIDFGSARQALLGPGQSQVVALTPGYAPVEQYPDNGKQGPWTDVYALGASLYRGIGGDRPVASTDRHEAVRRYQSDPLPAATQIGREHYPAYVLESIDWALRIHAKDRPQTARELQDTLMGRGRLKRDAAAPRAATFRAGKPASHHSIPSRMAKTARRPSKRRRSPARWLVAAAVVGAIGVGVVLQGSALRAHFPGLMASWDQITASVMGSSWNRPIRPRYKHAKKRPPSVDGTAAVEARSTQETGRGRSATASRARRSTAGSLRTELARTLTGHGDWVHAVAFAPDGTRLASGGYDQTIRVWDASTGALKRVLRGHDRSVNSIAYSADGKWLVSGGDDGTVRLWEAGTGRARARLQSPGYAVFTVAFSPASTRIAGAGKDRSVFVWDVESRELLFTLEGHRDDVHTLAFSPDGRYLASAGTDRIIRLWNLAKRREAARFAGHKDTVLSLAFSPDGTWLASGGSKGVVKLWDVAQGRLLRTFAGVRHGVLSLVFSPDGKWLATGGGGNVIKLWHPETASVAATLRGHRDFVQGLAFSPDGAALASASRDQTVKLWSVQ